MCFVGMAPFRFTVFAGRKDPRTFRFGGYKHAPLAAYRTDLIDDSVVLVCHRQRLRELGDQYVPGQQVTDAIDWVLCDADEHVTQIGFGIDAV
ncbi:hypothetical protein WJ35_15190 [Burkholderia ubonensis]|uniref:Uncharacterized protein n=1 Tax=Burkholderia ubonensis TaxID=101571 RepID=A0A1B4LH03_9BURK|nr:hypothetical protein AK36_5349 [Burkholderia vietnamiensis LMG 10929]AOJ76466.1 hypothetical protein WJ35_15190 [Burkholderia ubonensis]AOK13555.1 hypothetical protein WK31_24645 [Burkholderia vietnamiensis]KVF35321.1 hypothetical protein WJ09_10080 [Burkholderia vietnamiensis]